MKSNICTRCGNKIEESLLEAFGIISNGKCDVCNVLETLGKEKKNERTRSKNSSISR